mmetsp:Transcript_30810/g.71599  ORF Transcript_30810/g.71599 Transcript_30810/m.71599 type:complete len:220 (-) Transcript_30810:803-1462(-)
MCRRHLPWLCRHRRDMERHWQSLRTRRCGRPRRPAPRDRPQTARGDPRIHREDVLHHHRARSPPGQDVHPERGGQIGRRRGEPAGGGRLVHGRRRAGVPRALLLGRAHARRGGRHLRNAHHQQQLEVCHTADDFGLRRLQQQAGDLLGVRHCLWLAATRHGRALPPPLLFDECAHVHTRHVDDPRGRVARPRRRLDRLRGGGRDDGADLPQVDAPLRRA